MIFSRITERKPIEKGWSGDRKYCAFTAEGEKYLLRLSSPDRFERKRREFERMQQAAELGHVLLPGKTVSREVAGRSLSSTKTEAVTGSRRQHRLTEAQVERTGRTDAVAFTTATMTDAPAFPSATKVIWQVIWMPKTNSAPM